MLKKRCKSRTTNHDGGPPISSWWNYYNSKEAPSPCSVLLRSSRLLAGRECKWHAWQVWLIIKPCSALIRALTNGSAHGTKEAVARNKAEWKRSTTSNTFVISDFSAAACYASPLLSPLRLCLYSGRLKRLWIVEDRTRVFLLPDNRPRMEIGPINQCKACVFAYIAGDDADRAFPPCKCNMINGPAIKPRRSRKKKSFKAGEKNRQHVHYLAFHRFVRQHHVNRVGFHLHFYILRRITVLIVRLES